MHPAARLAIFFLALVPAACNGGSGGSTPPVASDSAHHAVPNNAALLYVANRGNDESRLGAVLEFGRTDSGNKPPRFSISGSLTGIKDPDAIAVDATKGVYIANYSTRGIYEFAPGAQGNVEPAAKIVGQPT